MRAAAAWLVVLVATAPALAGSYTARDYVARWDADSITVLTPSGGELLHWPVGATCSGADPGEAACPRTPEGSVGPGRAVVDGIATLTWRWRFEEPYPFSEQVETYRLLPDRVELRVSVRWRDGPQRLLRMVYGGRLAPRCADLEGLWQAHDGAAWVPSPVPGVTQRAGELPFRRLVSLRAGEQPLRLVLGGVDDGDVTSWDGREIGRTPSDSASASWEAVRRYDLDAGPAGEHLLAVDVTNAAGSGGLWRGPCVLGPRRTLEATPHGDGWTRATARGRTLHHWCPDSYRQPLTGRFTVSLTSLDRTREWVPENVTSGGRFLLPPYLVAIESDAGWWGLGTLDVPRAEDGLRVEWRDGGLTCPFLLATEPDLAAGGWTVGPRLAILPATSRQDTMRRYLAALPPRRSGPRHDWWSGPEYCTWGDQSYASQGASDSDVGTLSEEHLRTWLGALAERGLEAPLIGLDAGWWQLPRQAIDELHAEGRHVLLWTQPHWQPDTTQHAEWAMHDVNGRPLTYDPSNWIVDYTAPEVREQMGQAMRSYVSPEGWDADGIKMDFPYTPAPVWAVHRDPSWGAGEQYRGRVLRFCYEAIKSAKPDSLVTCVSANPLLAGVQDVCRLNDDWTSDPETYRRRAEVALAVGEWANCDDWYAYEHTLEAQAVERPVWGTFTLMSALYRGDRQNARMPLSPEWTARLRAIMRLARLAPVREGQRCTYDPDAGIARREGADGSLVATALRLEGEDRTARVLVVADGERLLVTATASGRVVIPTTTSVARVEAVGHDGTRRAVPFEKVPDGLTLIVEDAAGPVEWYEVVPERD